jgi:hypothetical protein
VTALKHTTADIVDCGERTGTGQLGIACAGQLGIACAGQLGIACAGQLGIACAGGQRWPSLGGQRWPSPGGQRWPGPREQQWSQHRSKVCSNGMQVFMPCKLVRGRIGAHGHLTCISRRCALGVHWPEPNEKPWICAARPTTDMLTGAHLNTAKHDLLLLLRLKALLYRHKP